MSKKLTNDINKKLYEKFGLTEDDVFLKENKYGKVIYKIISRQGIDKIAAKSKAEVNMNLSHASVSNGSVLVIYQYDGVLKDDDGNIIREESTTGEALIVKSSDGGIDRELSNVSQTQPYPAAMAEKRGRSRIYLKLEGLYELGYYGEDEADDFSNHVMKSKSSQKPNEDKEVNVKETDFPDDFLS